MILHNNFVMVTYLKWKKATCPISNSRFWFQVSWIFCFETCNVLTSRSKHSVLWKCKTVYSYCNSIRRSNSNICSYTLITIHFFQVLSRSLSSFTFQYWLYILFIIKTKLIKTILIITGMCHKRASSCVSQQAFQSFPISKLSIHRVLFIPLRPCHIETSQLWSVVATRFFSLFFVLCVCVWFFKSLNTFKRHKDLTQHCG